jgi:hypothetical protein
MKIACRLRALRDSAARRNEAAAAQLQHKHPSLLSSGHGAASFLFCRLERARAAIQPIETAISASPFGFSASILRLIEVAEFPETSAVW